MKEQLVPIKTAFISCHKKEDMLPLAQYLKTCNIAIYSTSGTHAFLQEHAIPSTDIKEVTGYPSILGGRIKTLHPTLLAGILAKRDCEESLHDIKKYAIQTIDLVVVDLYLFQETVEQQLNESECIEKIDIGGVTLIRSAAKNYVHTTVLSSPMHYTTCIQQLKKQQGALSLHQRKCYAADAFNIIMEYDMHIARYFNAPDHILSTTKTYQLRYGENPHQKATYFGNLNEQVTQLHGKALSYNNILDVDTAINILEDIRNKSKFWGILKHSNICGAAIKTSALEACKAALAGDPESVFGGILFTNQKIEKEIAKKIQELFTEIVIAPSISKEALLHLQYKTTVPTILIYNEQPKENSNIEYKSALNGLLKQTPNTLQYSQWENVSLPIASQQQKQDLLFANILCKHLKSNAISVVKDGVLLGKGAGQTNRIDAVKQAIAKAKQFGHNLYQSSMASDGFFPFDDCVKIAHQAGISSFIQPGGSIRDNDSISYCRKENLVMVLSHTRHFKH